MRCRARDRRCLVARSGIDVTLPVLALVLTCLTICSASTCSLTLVRWDTRRSSSNASSGPHPCWAITMPFACSITGMVLSLARSRANAESPKTSRRDRPRRTW